MSSRLYAQEHFKSVVILSDYFASLPISSSAECHTWFRDMLDLSEFSGTYHVCAKEFYSLWFRMNTLLEIMVRVDATFPDVETSAAFFYLRKLYWESHCWAVCRQSFSGQSNARHHAWYIVMCISPLVY